MGVPLNIDWQQILLHLFNFVILFAILYFLLYKPVRDFIEKRNAYYRSVDEKAGIALSDAEAQKKAYEEKLRAADAEIAEMLSQARREADDERKSLIRAAQDEAASIIRAAGDDAQRKKEEALREAQSEISEIVIVAANRLAFNAETSDVYDQFLSAVERSGTDA